MALVATAAVQLAPASAGVSFDPTPATCDSRSVAQHIKAARGIAKAGWSRQHWRHGPKRAQSRAIRDHLGCLERREDREKIKGYVAERAQALRRYRAYRQLAPYHGGGRWWAIPYYIVSCESGGSWGAYNPSGASGPYQLLGWGAPMPANTWRRRMQHHRIAARLWSGGAGASHWVCA